MRRGRPVNLLLCASLGLIAGQLTTGWSSRPALTAALLTAATFAALTARHRALGWPIAVTVLAMTVGHASLAPRVDPALPADHVARVAGDRFAVRGTIVDHPGRRPAGLRFVLDVEAARIGRKWSAARGRLQVTVRHHQRSWSRGDRLEAEVRARTPRNFGNPGEFDYERYLARRQIYRTGYSLSDETWRRLERPPPPWNDSIRRQARAAIEQLASDRVRHVANALLLGDGASIPPDLRQRYARAGGAHLLAISGLHIGLLAAATYLLCRALLARSESVLLRWNVPKLATAACLPLVLAYAAVAGGSAATVRATVMAALFLSGLILDRARHWPTAVAAAAALVCIGSPGAAEEASFQLSFAAVIGILVAGGRVLAAYDSWAERSFLHLRRPTAHRVLRWTLATQTASLVALAATAPLTLHHFQQLSLVGLVSNPVVVPLAGFGGVGIGLAGVLLTPLLPGAGAVLLGVACLCLEAADLLIGWFAGFPGAALRLPTPSAFEVAIYYALLACPLLAARRRFAVVAAVVVVALLQSAHWYELRHHADDLTVTFLSVGQGDSTLVELPGGTVMLVDGGGLSPTFDVGERLIGPLLRRRKIQSVDILVLTHPDFDHYDGLPAIAEQFAADELWTSGATKQGKRFAQFERRLRRSGARRRITRRGDAIEVGGAEISVLHPSATHARAGNDDSLTLRIAFGGTCILLAGDLEAAGEAELLRAYPDLACDILKAPHHGSKTSSSDRFLTAVRPRVAVASVGYRNRYSMPHRLVLQRYRRHGIRLLRTDEDGAVTVRVGPTGSIAVESGRRRRTATQLAAGYQIGSDA